MAPSGGQNGMSNEVTFDPLLRVNLVRDTHLHPPPPFSSGDGSEPLSYSDTFGALDFPFLI